jgi:hypothetical protein
MLGILIRRKKEEGRRKKEEGRRKKEEGRRKKEESPSTLRPFDYAQDDAPLREQMAVSELFNSSTLQLFDPSTLRLHSGNSFALKIKNVELLVAFLIFNLCFFNS